jgi:hypothetical protein
MKKQMAKKRNQEELFNTISEHICSMPVLCDL